MALREERGPKRPCARAPERRARPRAPGGYDGRAPRPCVALALAASAVLYPSEALSDPLPYGPQTIPSPAATPSESPASAPSAEPAPPSAEPASPSAEPAPPSAEPAPTQSPLEVTVEGERAPPGSTVLGRREIRDMPGVLGDPYRAIEMQPGVTPAATGIPYYFIRGAPPGNIGYFFDGIRVPLLFHVGAGPSVIPAAVVQRVELHPGPYPVRLGGFAGAVVEAESAPPSYAWRGQGEFRFGDLGGLIEGPLGEHTDLLVGGHLAIGALLVSALVSSVDVAYADYQARATYRLGPDSRVSVFAFGAYDYLATHSDDAGDDDTEVLLDSDFHRLDLRYERDSPSGDNLHAAVTLGLDQSRGLGVDRARDWMVAARVDVARPTGDGRVILRGGLDAALDGYEVTPSTGPCVGQCPPDASDTDVTETQLNEAFRELFPSRIDLTLGAWADAVLALDDRSTITPGIRLDHYLSLGETALAVDPRLVGRFGVGDHLHLVPAVGLASQLPGFAPLPALQIGGLPGGLQRSLQTSFGAELHLGPIEAVASIFRQATFELTDPIGTGRGSTFGPERFLTRSLGDAYGLELGARGALRRDLFFVTSYTLSRATRSREGRVLPSAYDRTHVLHAALLYDLGRGVHAGVRHVFYSGFPADESGSGHEPSEHPDRVKPFYRLDVRVSKRWKLGERSYIGLVADIQNATLSKETFDVVCDVDGCTPRTLGPITIPALAVEAGF